MVLIFAKNLTSSFPFCFNIFLLLLYLYFNILLLLSYFLYLLYTVNLFSFTHFRYCVSTFSYKHMPQCKFSLYLKKAGLASRNMVHFLKKVILRCIGLCFHYHHLYLLSRLDQPYTCRIIVHGCLLGHYSELSLPSCLFQVVASELSLPSCRFRVVASKLSLPSCRFRVVASELSLPSCRF